MTIEDIIKQRTEKEGWDTQSITPFLQVQEKSSSLFDHILLLTVISFILISVIGVIISIFIYRKYRNKIIDPRRYIGGVIYFLLGIFFLFLLMISKNLYSTLFFYRFFYVLAWAFIAFAFRAFKASKELPKSKIPAWKCYPTSYLITLIMLSSLVFAILHLSESTSNYLFYFFSWPIIFILSYNIDHIKDLLFNRSPLEILRIIIKTIRLKS